MKILLAEDDRFSREVLEEMTKSLGFDVCLSRNGKEGIVEFTKMRPEIVITDWLMPEMNGLELIKRIRASNEISYTYIIMISGKNRKDDLVQAMQAGVDDFLGKPFHREELKVRLRAAERIIQLQQSLTHRIQELEEAYLHVQRLQGFLPICAYCKKVRNDEDFWEQLENYISERAQELKLSHSICPACYESHVKPMQEKFYIQHAEKCFT